MRLYTEVEGACLNRSIFLELSLGLASFQLKSEASKRAYLKLDPGVTHRGSETGDNYLTPKQGGTPILGR